MKTVLTLISLLLSLSNAFVVTNNVNTRVGSKLSMAMDQAPPASVAFTTPSTSSLSDVASPVTMGVNNFLESSSSNMVAIQEYRKPTPEELAAKKRNFNLWFWGGGFVAPFIATVFYFGPKFWTK